MTDIRRHLPIVIAALRRHVPGITDAVTHAAARAAVLAELRDELPASYVVTTGRLADAHNHTSAPSDVVLLDATIPDGGPTLVAGVHPIRRAIVLAHLAGATDAAGLAQLLAALASAKALRQAGGTVPAASPSRSLPKGRLPLGVVCLASFTGNDATPLAMAQAMAACLHAQPEAVRPEMLFALAQRLHYRNPALDGLPSHPYTLGFATEPDLVKPRICYSCKTKFQRQHLFYGALCQSCGDLNLHKRTTTVDLAGRRALVTGGRVRIGYATALRLLRAGAQVSVTTRFPRDAARRYAAEPDCAAWRDRLDIFGLDLRHLPEVERFAQYLRTTAPHLDILINNAAQTVRHPPAHEAALVAGEASLAELTAPQVALLTTAAIAGFLPVVEVPTAMTPMPEDAAWPSPGSWDLRITDEIDLGEMLEAQIINATAPLLLINRLRLLLRLSPHPDRYIINVTSAEGAFGAKLGTHPHTNMAKAALNMLTYSAAADLAREGIHMNAVDPGWVSPQRPPAGYRARGAAQPIMPLDEVDAAARLCDPIYTANATGATLAGRCFKDYREVPW